MLCGIFVDWMARRSQLWDKPAMVVPGRRTSKYWSLAECKLDCHAGHFRVRHVPWTYWTPLPELCSTRPAYLYMVALWARNRKAIVNNHCKVEESWCRQITTKQKEWHTRWESQAAIRSQRASQTVVLNLGFILRWDGTQMSFKQMSDMIRFT